MRPEEGDRGATPGMRIGEVDLSGAVKHVNVDRGVGREGTAVVRLDPTHPALVEVDYSRLVTIYAVHEGVQHPLFTGTVRTAKIDSGLLSIECSDMAAFGEHTVGHLQIQNCGLDVIYSLARTVGVPDENIRIDGQDLSFEVFEVVTPVVGVASEFTVHFGEVSIIPSGMIGRPAICKRFDMDGDASGFANAEAHAVTYVTERRMHDAQERALARIDDVLAWLTVRSRYSLAPGPDGGYPDWSRGQLLTRPERGRLVSVCGLLTGRAWLRTVSDSPTNALLEILDEVQEPGLADDSLRLAILSCRRAATSGNFVERISAIWESIEYLVGKSRAPKMFSKIELDRIRDALKGSASEGLSPPQKGRVDEAFASLNSAPLMARFVAKIEAEGWTCSDDEFTLLKDLRGVRNDVSHGRPAVDPGREAVDRGVSILARLLVQQVRRPAGTS